MIKRKIDSCESTDYIIEPNYHFIQTNTNYDKLNKIIERISNYDNPDKSNILQKSIINQLPHTNTDQETSSHFSIEHGKVINDNKSRNIAASLILSLYVIHQILFKMSQKN